MGILYSEVKYYSSAVVDYTDSSLNGGGIGAEILNDTLHSIFPEISASQRELGVTLRAKIFVKNESTDRVMQDSIFYIKQDVQPDDRLLMYDALSETSVEADEDFTTLKKYANSVIKSTVLTGSTIIDIPIVDKSLFETGDNIVIVDEYFRATYRGTISDIQDSVSDVENATITLSSAYTSTRTIPSLSGYLCNGAKQTMAPTEFHAMWLELTVAPTNAIDAEIVNQFQVGVHFDDVTV
jgi:hypothetical protein